MYLKNDVRLILKLQSFERVGREVAEAEANRGTFSFFHSLLKILLPGKTGSPNLQTSHPRVMI